MPVEVSGGALLPPGVTWCSGTSPLATQITVTCENGYGETATATSLGSEAVASALLVDSNFDGHLVEYP